MLTRSNNIGTQEKYFADSLLTPPSITTSVFENLALGYATPQIAMKDLDEHYGKTPEGQGIHSLYESVQIHNDAASGGQWLANEGANMIGMALNPMTALLAEAGGASAGLAVRGVSAAGARAAPSAATVLARKPLFNVSKLFTKEQEAATAASIAEKGTKTFGAFAGAGVPQAVEENRNADTGHINWGGVAKDAGATGAMGIAIGSIPFGLGVLKAKVNRGLGEPVTAEMSSQKVLQAFERKQITPDEMKWYQDYQEHLKNPGDKKVMQDLQERASRLIHQNGHDVNFATHEAPFKFLPEKDMQNLQGAISDQLVSNVPEELKTSLSDFMVHSRLDDLSENPAKLDGLRGYVDFLNEKLKVKDEKLAAENEIIDKHLEKGLKENMPLSQKALLKEAIKGGKDRALVHPEEVDSHLRELEKIKTIESSNKKLFKKYKKTGNNAYVEKMKANDSKINELKSNLTKPLSPKEELKAIREKLITEKGLKKNFERTPEYHRLLDLSSVWHNAKTLLDRIHVEHEYNKQEAFKTLAEHYLKIADSNSKRLAKADKVVDYLKNRIEGSLKKPEPIEPLEAKVSETRNVPSNSEEILTQQGEQFKQSHADEMKKEFDQSQEKFKEFKKSEGIFKNFIQCVLGAANV